MSLTANGANDNRSSSEQPCEQETLLARTARRGRPPSGSRRRPELGAVPLIEDVFILFNARLIFNHDLLGAQKLPSPVDCA